MPPVGMWELATEIVRQEGYVPKWRLEGDDAEELAVRYLLLLQQARDFEVSFQCGYTHPGRRGVLWICSSDASTRMHMEGYGRLDGHPPCMEFHVYFLEGMDLGDVRDRLFHLPEPLFLGPLGAFVGAVYPLFSLEALRSYPQREGQMYFDVLREIVGMLLGAPCWIEVSVCRSFLEYRALNVYWSLRTPGDGQVDPSWWLMNWEEPPRSRRQVHPAKWYRCQDYLWVGRAGAHADYLLRSLEGGAERGVALSRGSFCPLDESRCIASAVAARGVSAGIIQSARPGFPMQYATLADWEAYGVMVSWVRRESTAPGKGRV